MDLRDLAYFEVIADLGHMGRAADKLGRTQPALTKCIQRLEEAVGADLFERTGRGITLTRVGEVLLLRARRMRAAMEECLREVSDFAVGSAGHVRIGCGATMGEYLLPQVCRALIDDSPGVTIEVHIAMSGVLRTALRDGTLDFAIGPFFRVTRRSLRTRPSESTRWSSSRHAGMRSAQNHCRSTISSHRNGFFRPAPSPCVNGSTSCSRPTACRSRSCRSKPTRSQPCRS
jgi:DNA-binding transcriptional LysR family regulator